MDMRPAFLEPLETVVRILLNSSTGDAPTISTESVLSGVICAWAGLLATIIKLHIATFEANLVYI